MLAVWCNGMSQKFRKTNSQNWLDDIFLDFQNGGVCLILAINLISNGGHVQD